MRSFLCGALILWRASKGETDETPRTRFILLIAASRLKELGPPDATVRQHTTRSIHREAAYRTLSPTTKVAGREGGQATYVAGELLYLSSESPLESVNHEQIALCCRRVLRAETSSCLTISLSSLPAVSRCGALLLWCRPVWKFITSK